MFCAMNRKLMIVALMAMLFVGVQSADAQVRKWEAEIGVGGISPTNKLEFDKNTLGWNVLVEARRNLNMLPLDLGLRVDGNVFKREYKSLEDLKNTQFKSFNAMAVADLNLFRKSKIQVFVGCGLGYGWLANQVYEIGKADGTLDTVDKVKDAWNSKSALVAMPRVGVELFHHLRATLYYKVPADKVLVKEQGHFGLSLGVVLGGGLKE